MTQYAYVDSTGDVVAVSTAERTLEEVQTINPEITEVISEAPDEITPKWVGELLPLIGSYATYGAYHRKISGDGTDISHYEEVTHLSPYRRIKYAEIDAVDVQLIEQGFEYPAESGNIFSLSSNAQKKMIMLHQVRDQMSYPVPVSLRDDEAGVYLVADADDMNAMGQAAVERVGTVIGSGDLLKAAIRDASSREEIDAIVDDRLGTMSL